MNTRTLLLLSLLVVNLFAYAKDEQQKDRTMSLRIIPTPQQVTLSPGQFKITSQTRIILGENSSTDDSFAADQLNAHLQELKSTALKVVNEGTVKGITSNYIFIGSPESKFIQQWMKTKGLSLSPEMKEEGYILETGREGIMIIAESPRGRFYGVMSLVQMIERGKKDLVVPGALLKDWPLQKMRGITDDLSRGQVSTINNFKKIIRFLARYKLNIYSPYIEDIFAFKNHPLIGKGRGALTAAEIKELDAYAKKYHVELIPIFETLGHWENILLMPEYMKYAEFPGAHTVNVSDEAVYALLDEMIGELAAAFSSSYFNMAADESWDVGLGVNKQRVAASDIATVHAEHYKRLFDILKKHGKKPMMYGDIILNNPAILEKIPKDVVIVDWHYGVTDRYSSPEIFNKAGFPYVESPAVWNFTGPFPNYINTFVNVQYLNNDGYRNGSLGLLTSNWNDYGGEALRELNYYGYAWTGECAWQPLRAEVASFNEKFFTDFFGNAEAGKTAQAVYAILSDPVNQMNWHELWRHPMLPLREQFPHYLWRVQSIESSMPLARKLLADLRQQAVRNADHLQYLDFVTRLNLWYAKKLRVGEQIKRLMRDTSQSVNKDSLQRTALEAARPLVPELKKLKEDFRTAWLTTNQEANLQWLMLRYDRQVAYWQETINEIEQVKTATEPVIESQWIYHPNANPGKRDQSLTQVPQAYFRKTFSLEQALSSAKLQLIGDTHAKVWVNGTEVGEVYGRRSLSLIVEHGRVKMWDVTSLLKKGTNVIAIEAANYNQNGSAGFNVYAELQSGSVVTKILTDSAWKVSDKAVDGWKQAQFDDKRWIQAAPKAYSNPVIRPNFGTRRLSWIER